MKLKTLKKEVEYCLEKYEKARNSDIYLTNAVWIHFYKDFLRMYDNDWCLPLKYNGYVASRDDIKRIRAKIQNDEKRFLPTNWEVAKKRKWKEQEYYEYFKNDNPAKG